MRPLRLNGGIAQAGLLAAAAIVVFPFLWITAAGFRSRISLIMGEFWFTPIIDNFNELLFSGTSDFLQNFMNSVIVGTASTAIVLAISTLGAYSLARLEWPRWLVYALLLWSVVFHILPAITLVGAWYFFFRWARLYNTYAGLVLAHVALNLPLALWLMTAFMREVPKELEEAARIDGCSIPNLIWRVILPVILPGLVAVAMLVFISSWNEFVVTLNLSAKHTQTVPLAIAKYAQENEIKFGEMAAGSALSVIPALLLLLIGQRYIVRGLTAGAVK
ncbi:MAG: carbohydrate ABC transporter permease [Proteobacteria bacterium]|nr:carbohydrate ABC transporter permease [Pseudomonadota bacterium]MBI3497747.1 carbohydrate ABC transporter permease [Pseudomonadota bacterium]